MKDKVYTHNEKELNLQKYKRLLDNIDDVEIEEIKYDELYQNKTENTIISEAQQAISNLEKSTPKLKVISFPPDKEIAYKQKYQPLCKLCNHAMRNDAEAVYVKNNFVPQRVVKWFESIGEHFTWECIATHMGNHCVWDKPLINAIEKIAARQDEMSIIKQDRIQWNLDALTSANLDLLSQLDSLSGEDSVKTYNAVCNGMKVQAQLMKLQHDTMGAQAQAKSMIEANNKRLVNFLERLMEKLPSEYRIEVLEFIREFQAEEARKQ